MDIINFEFNFKFNITSFKEGNLIGTSDCNEYIPFYALAAHNLIVFEEIEDRVIEYNLPMTPPRYQRERMYRRLNSHLRSGEIPKRYNFVLKGEKLSFNIHRGLIYKDEEIYLGLAINSEYLLSTPIEEIKNNIDYSKFKLFISNKFSKDNSFKNINKKLEAMYIEELKILGVDIIYTNDVNERIFKNNFKKVKFKNMAEMVKYLDEEVPKILLIE